MEKTLCKFFRFRRGAQIFLVAADDKAEIDKMVSWGRKKLAPRYAAIYYGPDGLDASYCWRARNARGYSPVSYAEWGYVQLYATKKEAAKHL